jgi:hypothetical protein
MKMIRRKTIPLRTMVVQTSQALHSLQVAVRKEISGLRLQRVVLKLRRRKRLFARTTLKQSLLY